jgi:hypothetical protein
MKRCLKIVALGLVGLSGSSYGDDFAEWRCNCVIDGYTYDDSNRRHEQTYSGSGAGSTRGDAESACMDDALEYMRSMGGLYEGVSSMNCQE